MFDQFLRLLNLETGFVAWQRLRHGLGHAVTDGPADRIAYLASYMGRDR